jgi:hypothetical protein
VRAVLTARHMAAQRCRATALDSRHDFQLAKAEVTGGGLSPGSTVGVEDIRDFKRWAGHEAEKLAPSAGKGQQRPRSATINATPKSYRGAI